MKNKKYKLLKWFPTLPKDWEVGMELKKEKYSQYYSNINKKYPEQFLLDEEVENNPEFFEEIIEKEVLFVTEDGKEIKTGGEYWYVVASDSAAIPWRWKALHDVANWTHEGMESKKPPLGYYQFSSEEKAQEWIVLNKPCLSLMEATLAIQRTSLFYKEKDSIVENLKKLVESKL